MWECKLTVGAENESCGVVVLSFPPKKHQLGKTKNTTLPKSDTFTPDKTPMGTSPRCDKIGRGVRGANTSCTKLGPGAGTRTKNASAQPRRALALWIFFGFSPLSVLSNMLGYTLCTRAGQRDPHLGLYPSGLRRVVLDVVQYFRKTHIVPL